MKDNAKILKDGFAKGLKMVEDALFISLWDSAVALLKEVVKHREFIGFTGNTQTSYACGIYVYGELEGVVTQDNWHEPPIRKKVRKYEHVYLENPYEGDARSVRGEVDVDDNYGLETSLNFLEGYKANKKSICLVMCTGTEYSELLESVRKLDVLTGTYEASTEIIEKNWKKIE